MCVCIRILARPTGEAGVAVAWAALPCALRQITISKWQVFWAVDDGALLYDAHTSARSTFDFYKLRGST